MPKSRTRSADIAIVGGGPAGLSAALEAARAGARCVLYEKGIIGGRIQCAEGLFDPSGLVEAPSDAVRGRIREALLRVQGNEYRLPFQGGKRFCILDRASWQQELGRQARDLGVDVREGQKADPASLARIHEAVIDARGCYAFFPGWRTLPEPPGLGVQWTLSGGFRSCENTLEVEIHPSSPAYFWIFPKGREEVNVGFGWLILPSTPVVPWEELERFLRRRGLSDARRIRRTGGFMVGNPIPASPILNVYRVGDAGGFGSPLHGGGIDAAWHSGRLAVRAVLAGDRSLLSREMDRSLGAMRHMERHLLRRWIQEGPAILDRAGRHLKTAAPLLRVSTRFLTGSLLAPQLLRIFGSRSLPAYFHDSQPV